MARPRTFDEEKVLAGAVEAFREGGYEGTSLPALIDRLGICRQSLYSTFGDKRGLYLKALARWGEIEIGAKVALLAGPGSPLENVRTVLRGWAALAPLCPSEGCLTARAIVEVHDDPEALAVVEAQVERLDGGFLDALTRAEAAGELKSDVRPERLAHALTTVAYGLGVLSRLPGSGRRIADTVSTMISMVDAAAA
jgi:TetR/AcrR family transcriptional repressor of nem operon